MAGSDNIVSMERVRDIARHEIVDDISARAFLLLRDEAEEQGVSLKEVITRHLAGIAEVVSAVEGPAQARELFASVSRELPTD